MINVCFLTKDLNAIPQEGFSEVSSLMQVLHNTGCVPKPCGESLIAVEYMSTT